MKPLHSILAVTLATLFCGCGSIVKSTKETVLPKTTTALTGIRYYLPRGKAEVDASWDNDIPGWQPTIKPVIEADPTACYRVDRNANVLFDDDITLQVDPATGLLQCATASSTDESVAAIASLATAAAEAVTFGADIGAAMTSGARGSTNLTPEQLADFENVKANALSSKFSVVLDSQNPKQTCYVVEPDSSKPSNASAKLYAKYVIELKRINDEPNPGGLTVEDGKTIGGIVFRIPIPQEVTVNSTFYKEGFQPRMNQPKTQILFLPDDDRDYFLPLDRLPFVTTSTKVTLANGMIQSLQRTRPSMVNAIAGVPKSLLSALTPIPVAINQYNIQNGGGKTAAPAAGPKK
ncbi:MAG TPA: hypothetical protein VK815_12685 [Candidatus Acidoferrales bacterium]|nr:hypothetical protein [Candidatus Acidoferrales bacterium]